MPCFAGLDASKHTTHICVLDAKGRKLDEGVTATEPKAIAAFLRGRGRRYLKIGMEAWSLSSWLAVGLEKAKLPVVVIEAQHAHGALSTARRNKTDRNDARGIAELMRRGAYKSVHVKTRDSQDAKAGLSVRKLLVSKIRDIENGIQGMLLTYGLKLRSGLRKTLELQARALAVSVPQAAALLESLLAVRRAMQAEVAALEAVLTKRAESDPVCARLMTAPGVGVLTALAFRAAIDDPHRFRRSRSVGAHLGLTPRTRQSGEKEVRGGITKMGDSAARSALFLAAVTQMRRTTKPSWLKTWADQVAARRGRKKAVVAVARRLAVTLHSMWVTETDFRWAIPSA